MFKKITLFLFATVLLLTFDGGFGIATTNTVRVAVLRETDHFTIAIDGRYKLVDFNTGALVDKGVRLRPTLVSMSHGKIKVGDVLYQEQRLIIEPRKDALMSVQGKHFRGSLVLINNSGETMTVVNTIELEQYIRGVLYHEVSDKWPLEAIKAQAVATRTYALYSMEKFAGRDYDMTNDVYSQVYGGRSAERYRTNLAVKRTKGEVLNYKGKIFPTFFHANSGGVTEDASELWDVDIPPLKGNVASPFSVNSPHYRWKLNCRLKDIQDKLNDLGYGLGLIKDISVMERNKSGRVRKVRITTREGSSVVVEGKVFREVLGPNVLKSNKYEIAMKGWFVDFAGYGWGHGVGMCQWGAYNMALLRYDYKKILLFYYPGAEMLTLRDID